VRFVRQTLVGMGQQNIILIGLMAVGKSTVGKHMAGILGREFYDSDRVIEERAGADTTWIFDVEGEQGFRDRETHVLSELTALEGVVIATGGGAVLRKENRTCLSKGGIVVHLDSSLKQLVERTRHDKKRPLLKGGNREQILRTLWEERTQLYASIADYRFTASRSGPKQFAQKIVNQLQNDGLL